ncbi:hypothetical protein SLEP1_g36018 [Rubroshorea leprosula]|uniref:Uncharacterized protein n=1 Tax=Rubroshorea leprosula TaxID=152421 RepID=A0AAV5KQN5_9ROSI|nr:hypothetical protein SLEP1_g36018 [Rubroshorea leprosula]
MSGSAMVGDSSSWSRALLQISPYTFSAVGIAIAVGVSVLGAAWYEIIAFVDYSFICSWSGLSG